MWHGCPAKVRYWLSAVVAPAVSITAHVKTACLRMTGSPKLRDLPIRCGPVFGFALTNVRYWHKADIAWPDRPA
jgi:hypothetical protein